MQVAKLKHTMELLDEVNDLNTARRIAGGGHVNLTAALFFGGEAPGIW